MRNKVLTIIGVVIGVLVLLLMTQTEGFVIPHPVSHYKPLTADEYKALLAAFEARNNSPEDKAFLAAEAYATAAVRDRALAANAAGIKAGDIRVEQKLLEQIRKDRAKILSDQLREKGIDPQIGNIAYWRQHYGDLRPAAGKVQNAGGPQPAVKNMPAVAPSPSIVKKVQAITPSQPAPVAKVQNAIPAKTK
jgi:hypothetical protein